MAKEELKSKGPEKEEYILKPGFEHNGFNADGERNLFVGGEKDNDRVFLTKAQAQAFKDKFESVAEQKERLAAQETIAELTAEKDALVEALAEKGITLEDILNGNVETIKKPDNPGGVGTNEPTKDNVTPAPTGSGSPGGAPAKK